MESIFNQYGWSVLSVQQLHQGLINSTYSISTNQGDFILQTLNHHIFKDPRTIDDNINAIGNFLNQQSPNYHFTHLVPTQNGKTLVEWEGQFYRAFNQLNGYSLSVLDNSNQAKEAASQFGKFTQVLSEFNIRNLKITLPDFHNLSLRYHQFTEAIIKGNASKIDSSKESILFLKSLHPIVNKYEYFVKHPESLLRVTHHDTKISNVLFNKENGIEKAFCVIDLDTVMPGYFISDVGDMCRTYLCKVSEEEKDLNLIQIEEFTPDLRTKIYDLKPDLGLCVAFGPPYFDQEIKERQFEGQTWKSITDEMINHLPDKVYLSFDIDGLDRKLCPNTGTPVQGGFETEEIIYLVKKLIESGRQLIGFDLVEVGVGDTEWDSNVGARILWRLCNLMVKNSIK